jgi:hypothetical protein
LLFKSGRAASYLRKPTNDVGTYFSRAGTRYYTFIGTIGTIGAIGAIETINTARLEMVKENHEINHDKTMYVKIQK